MGGKNYCSVCGFRRPKNSKTGVKVTLFSMPRVGQIYLLLSLFKW